MGISGETRRAAGAADGAAADSIAVGPESATRAAEARAPRLDNLPSRPRLTGEEAAAHSALVRRLRIMLPLAAGALIVIFLLNARGGSSEDVFLEEFADVDAAAEELRMALPHFSGVDADGAPFDITAKAAVQVPGEDNIVNLEEPRAVTGDDAERSTLSAVRGAYSSDQNILILEDEVRFKHQIGEDIYILNTDAAVFAIEEETVVSDNKVEGEGPRGSRLKADRMFADNKTGRVIFEGNVSMRIYPEAEESCPESYSETGRPSGPAPGLTFGAPPRAPCGENADASADDASPANASQEKARPGNATGTDDASRDAGSDTSSDAGDSLR